MDHLEIHEHLSTGYRQRTLHNARSADLTAAFALNFETAGERLTRSVAGNTYVAIRLDEPAIQSARLLYSALKHFNAKSLNIAGNGIYTLSGKGWTQGDVDDYMFDVLETVIKHWPLEQIVSGGQTGADIAGITAAYMLGIPAIATLPRGFIQRNSRGKDQPHTKEQIEEMVITAAQWVQVNKTSAAKSRLAEAMR